MNGETEQDRHSQRKEKMSWIENRPLPGCRPIPFGYAMLMSGNRGKPKQNNHLITLKKNNAFLHGCIGSNPVRSSSKPASRIQGDIHDTRYDI
jgi:hypothetical protein